MNYKILSDTMYQTPKGLMEVRIQQVIFTKQLKNGEVLTHRACVITYADQQKHKLISLFTNDKETQSLKISSRAILLLPLLKLSSYVCNVN